ncbi:PilT/PilU family type 4a pilus ATPase [Demequina capsici]|uniref:PilT/PilU family type 4a pilus ATPase n=1 Tax=Demequina capsici TaxID=3075620 RepID=A0AA96JE06_9MICO|nr:PilT/PilU family type 4a pilus ATPase [Demequina sp. PMTSA13]WNM28666.1 PilT/PilU family type 4a pilus ATPase [Demequina sp. PMTSA13]
MPENVPGQGQSVPGAPAYAPQPGAVPQGHFDPVVPGQPQPQAAYQAPSAPTGQPVFAPTPAAPAVPVAQPVVQRQPLMPQSQPSASMPPVPGQVPGGYVPAGQPVAQPQQPALPPQAPQAPQAGSAPQAGLAKPSMVKHSAQPGPARVGMSNEVRGDDLDLGTALRALLKAGGSDLHLTVGAPPTIRVDGGLTPLEGYGKLGGDELQRVIYAILTQKQREDFETELELDLAYSLVGESRFRVNVYMQRESIGAAFRVIPYEILPLETLGIPQVVGTFAGLPRGLVLVTGPTGSGKSTTLASVIDMANRSRADHIMTVEDPIEFLHKHKKSLVNQREVGTDTWSFANALKHVLRQDPDIILVGEMRDLETISVALTAAETGHLVFGTLHTQDAAQTIDRVIDVFPAHQQDQIRVQLATALQGVVCQTLCKRADGPGRAVATEVMVATSAIRNLIREGKTHQIYSSMQAGQKQGMHTMDQHLANLVKAGKISYETGLEKCHHTEEFNRLSGRAGGTTQGATLAGGSM